MARFVSCVPRDGLIFRVVRAEHAVSEREHALPVLRWDPHQGAKHAEGQRCGDVRHEVARPTRRDRINDAVCELAHARLKLGTMRGVKPLLTSRRSRTWCGGSI